MRATAMPILMVFAIVLVSCAPATSRSPGESAGGAQAPAAPKSLAIALQNEPKALMTIMGGDAGGGAAAQIRLAIHQQLAMYDDRGQPYPMLAAELPSQSKGTWVLRPDGSMQTT